jgi:hypothetical protein
MAASLGRWFAPARPRKRVSGTVELVLEGCCPNTHFSRGGEEVPCPQTLALTHPPSEQDTPRKPLHSPASSPTCDARRVTRLVWLGNGCPEPARGRGRRADSGYIWRWALADRSFKGRRGGGHALHASAGANLKASGASAGAAHAFAKRAFCRCAGAGAPEKTGGCFKAAHACGRRFAGRCQFEPSRQSEPRCCKATSNSSAPGMHSLRDVGAWAVSALHLGLPQQKVTAGPTKAKKCLRHPCRQIAGPPCWARPWAQLGSHKWALLGCRHKHALGGALKGPPGAMW